MNDKEQLISIIQEVVQQFKFPDGCLDLGVDEQEAFITTLAERLAGYFDCKQG